MNKIMLARSSENQSAFRRDLLSFSYHCVSKVEGCQILEYPYQRAQRMNLVTDGAEMKIRREKYDFTKEKAINLQGLNTQND